MEPIEWALAAGLVALATYLSKCGGGGGDTYYYYGFGEDVPADGVVPDDASDGSVGLTPDEYVGPNGGPKKDKPGYNSKLLKLGCDIADIDISGSTLVGVCRNPLPGENYKKLFTADISDPKKQYAPTMYPAMTNTYDSIEGGNLISYGLEPEQVVRVGAGVYEKDYIVPFSGSSGANSCLSGMSALSGADGYAMHMTLFDGFSFPMENQQDPTVFRPCGVKSVMFDEVSGLWAPAAVSTDDGEIGILRHYDTASYQPLQPGTVSGHPVFLNGRKPSAIAQVSNPYDLGDPVQYAAVLNSQGYGNDRPYNCSLSAIGEDSFGCSNASIDIVPLIQPAAEGEKPAAVVDLKVPETVPLKQLPVTADGKYTVVVADERLIIVNLQKATIAGQLDEKLIEGEYARDIAVLGMKAYLTMLDSVYVFDFTDPKNPDLSDVIQVKSNVGSIALDASGIIYVTVPDDVDPSKGRTRVFSINPEEVQM